MKKNVLMWTRYFWWPLQTAANWLGAFINQNPQRTKSFQSPFIQNALWRKKFRNTKKRIRPDADPKGTPHADSKIFNHPRR